MRIPCKARRRWPRSAARPGLKMSTNMCVTRFAHIPEALKLKPIDVLLCDHHYFGGFAGCQALGPICQAAGWTMSQHSNNHAGITMAAMIHLAASIPELTLASDTHYPGWSKATDIIEGPKLTIQGGTMAVPPGRAGCHAGSATSSRVRRDLREVRDDRSRRPVADAAARAGLDRGRLVSSFKFARWRLPERTRRSRLTRGNGE